MNKNIKLALAFSGIAAAAFAPIATSIGLYCKPCDDISLQNAKEHSKFEAVSNSFTSSANSSVGSEYDDKITYSLVETRSYDGHGDKENWRDGGIRFDQTRSGYNGSRNGYKAPYWYNNGNTLYLSTTGHDNVYHFIAQKIKIDVLVPAHETNYKVVTQVNGNVTTYAHGAAVGYRVRHTLETFNLGIM